MSKRKGMKQNIAAGLRADLSLVAHLVPENSKVLDLGCGRGSLLSHLVANQGCQGTGVEIDHQKILVALGRGVNLLAIDIDTGLEIFEDDSFDVAVLSKTIQTIERPAEVLGQMARIADRLIVSVPNFGWWRHRLRLLTGRMPMSKELPYSWYDTPNIRFTTLTDLEELFVRLDLEVERRIAFTQAGQEIRVGRRLANLMAGAAVYVLRPGRGR